MSLNEFLCDRQAEPETIIRKLIESLEHKRNIFILYTDPVISYLQPNCIIACIYDNQYLENILVVAWAGLKGQFWLIEFDFRTIWCGNSAPAM